MRTYSLTRHVFKVRLASALCYSAPEDKSSREVAGVAATVLLLLILVAASVPGLRSSAHSSLSQFHRTIVFVPRLSAAVGSTFF
jgi:hypothetical protein